MRMHQDSPPPPTPTRAHKICDSDIKRSEYIAGKLAREMHCFSSAGFFIRSTDLKI